MPLMATGGTLHLIDAQALFYVTSEIGSNKNVVYKFLVIWGSIALVCDGSGVLGFEHKGLGLGSRACYGRLVRAQLSEIEQH
jgi:hypothetical protein